MSEWRVGSYAVRGDLGHLAGVTAIFAFCLWYLFDAAQASGSFQNLLLLAPATVIVALLYAVIVAGDLQLRRTEAPGGVGEAERPVSAPPVDRKQYVLMVLLVVFVLLMPILGFDVATFLFMVATLRMEGRQGWGFAILYALLFTVFTVGSLQWLLSVPVPTLLDYIG